MWDVRQHKYVDMISDLRNDLLPVAVRLKLVMVFAAKVSV